MSANGGTDLDVDTWNIAGEWNIAGPHALRGGYTKANDTGGSAVERRSTSRSPSALRAVTWSRTAAQAARVAG